ncbi:MAG: hypothetical protein NT154_46920 [Verrucomicrobia bacterium]|nr:hypothetical protein [Verrucomicrobiota bacterium]
MQPLASSVGFGTTARVAPGKNLPQSNAEQDRSSAFSNSLFLLSHLLAATNLARMNIPVTGGAGYIGSICTEALLAADL